MSPPEMIDAGPVVLRRWRVEFAEQAAAAVQASLNELAPFMPWANEAYDVGAAEAFVDHASAGWDERTDWNYAVFTPDGELAGSAGLHDRVGPGALELGYWLNTAHTGRGYATAVATALSRAALELPGIERVLIKHDAANPGSGAVAARAGFREVARRDDEITAPGESGVEVTWEFP